MDGDIEEVSEGLQHRVDYRGGSNSFVRQRLSKHGTTVSHLGDDAAHYPTDDNHRFFESVSTLFILNDNSLVTDLMFLAGD